MRWVISCLQIASPLPTTFVCMCRPRCRYQPSIYSRLFARRSIQPVLRRFSLPVSSFMPVQTREWFPFKETSNCVKLRTLKPTRKTAEGGKPFLTNFLVITRHSNEGQSQGHIAEMISAAIKHPSAATVWLKLPGCIIKLGLCRRALTTPHHWGRNMRPSIHRVVISPAAVCCPFFISHCF